jgi:hypothetical protein
VFSNYLVPRWRLSAVLLVGVVGCGESRSVDDLYTIDRKALVPAGGVVTVNRKPVEHAILTFLPPTGPTLGYAETDKDGKYQLMTMGSPGVLPGDYKVAISYFVSDEGEPQSKVARLSKLPGPGMRTAKERLALEYSDLGRTKLLAKVGAQGGTFDFDVSAEVPIAAAKPAETKAHEPKPADPKTPAEKE